MSVYKGTGVYVKIIFHNARHYTCCLEVGKYHVGKDGILQCAVTTCFARIVLFKIHHRTCSMSMWLWIVTLHFKSRTESL